MAQRRHSHLTWMQVFGILNFLASIFSFAWLSSIPSGQKDVVWLGLTLQRIGLYGLILLSAISFACLIFLSWRRSGFTHWVESNIFYTSWSAGLFMVLCFLALVVFFLTLLTPPFLTRAGPTFQRLLPVLILAGLISIDTAFLLLQYAPPVGNLCKKLHGEFNELVANPNAGWVLLGIAFIVSLTQIYYSFYNLGDEGDTLTTGWMIAQGNVLYRDVFSHHFPISYYWTAMVVKLFGPSIFAARFSFVILRTVSFGVAMKVSRYHFGLGLAALTWSILGQLYLGNMLQFYSFSGIFIASSFGLVLSIINNRSQSDLRALIAAGVFLAMAILTDPMTAYPAAIMVAVVFLAGVWRLAPERSLKRGFILARIVIVTIFACGAVYLMYLLATGSLQAFVQDAILFNTQVYNRYSNALRASQFFVPAMNGLGIFDPYWRKFTDPYWQLIDFNNIDQWVFSGFFYRLVFILSSAALILRRNYLAGIFVYLVGASLLLRAIQFFQSSSFVLLAFCVVSLGISGAFVGVSQDRSLTSLSGINKAAYQLRFSVLTIVMVLLGLMFAWLNLRGISLLIEHRNHLNYGSNFGDIVLRADNYNKLTCHLSDAKILVYPLDPVIYFLSGNMPASRYSFLTPWVAEVGQDETIAALNHTQLTLVYLDKDANIWGYLSRDYLKKLIDYLDHNYVKIGGNFFQSPQLHQICPAGG